MDFCAHCRSTKIEHLTDPDGVNYKGKFLLVPFEYSICSHCDREFVPPYKIQRNDDQVKAAKARHDENLG